MKLKAKYWFLYTLPNARTGSRNYRNAHLSSWDWRSHIVLWYFSHSTSDGYCCWNERRSWTVVAKSNPYCRRRWESNRAWCWRPFTLRYGSHQADQNSIGRQGSADWFAGSPWTILCYAVQGQGSKNFDLAKGFCYSQTALAHKLLQKITDTTIAYLKAKVRAGVDAVQLFDSWGGMLGEVDYQTFSWQYMQQIIDALKEKPRSLPLRKAVGLPCLLWHALARMRLE